MPKQLELPLYIPGSIYWKPMKDISTYELALALPVLLLTDERTRAQMFTELPPNVSRHFSYQKRAIK